MNSKSLIGNIGTVIMVLAVFVLILYLAYFATKKLGNRLSIKSIHNKNIKIIESISIGQHNAIMIIETAGKTLLVGVTQNGINLISELDSEKIITEIKSGNGQTMDFSTAFKTVFEEKFGKKFGKTKENDDDNSSQ